MVRDYSTIVSFAKNISENEFIFKILDTGEIGLRLNFIGVIIFIYKKKIFGSGKFETSLLLKYQTVNMLFWIHEKALIRGSTFMTSGSVLAENRVMTPSFYRQWS